MSDPKWEIGPVELADSSKALIYRFCEIRKVYIGEMHDHQGAAHACEWSERGTHWQGSAQGRDGKNFAPLPRKKVWVQWF